VKTTGRSEAADVGISAPLLPNAVVAASIRVAARIAIYVLICLLLCRLT
jgi:hypothetical protein